MRVRRSLQDAESDCESAGILAMRQFLHTAFFSRDCVRCTDFGCANRGDAIYIRQCVHKGVWHRQPIVHAPDCAFTTLIRPVARKRFRC